MRKRPKYIPEWVTESQREFLRRIGIEFDDATCWWWMDIGEREKSVELPVDFEKKIKKAFELIKLFDL